MQRLKIGLIGFSGSGKTTLAKEAHNRGYISADTDEIVRNISGYDPGELILSGREDQFRKYEEQSVREAISGDAEYIAFGGGIHFGRPVYRDIAASGTKLVYLRGSFEELLKNAPDRPMLQTKGDRGYRKLFEEREPLYLKSSNFVVDIDGRTCVDIFAQVESIWNLLFQPAIKQS
jgi:shikimate kinase